MIGPDPLLIVDIIFMLANRFLFLAEATAVQVRGRVQKRFV